MANNDSSQYVLRFNLITGQLEYDASNTWTPISLTSGTVTAADIDSETATDGQVLTADGMGGATWEDQGSLFTSTVTINPATNQLILGGVAGGFKTTITSVAPASDKVLTIPALGADTSVIVGFGNQTINGALTVSSLNAVLYLLVGTGSSLTEIDTLAASPRLVHIPDAGATSTFVVTESAQTLNGTYTFSKAQVLNLNVLGTTGTITPVATNGPTFDISVSGSVTLNGPSSPVDGQKVVFRILNDASHSVTLATGSGNFRFGTDITSYTNSVSKTDYVGAIYNAGATRWDVISVIQGF